MVFQKPTPIKTTIIIKTLIVLTIIDHAFSNLEVEYCTKSIKELYRNSTIYHNQRIKDIGSTTDDESINDNLLKMYKKGFLAYNESEINLINIFIAAKSTVQYQDRIVRKTMLERLKGYLQELLQWIPLYSTRDNIRKMNEYFAEKLQSVLDTEELQITVHKMNYYSYGYFKEFLIGVSINDKDSLKNPDQFCVEKYQERRVHSTVEGCPLADKAADFCIDITKHHFNLTGEESGSQIFDIFYEKWTKNEVQLAHYLDDERRELCKGYILSQFLPQETDNKGSEFVEIIGIYRESIASFYKQFEDKLADADASQMETPENYCARIIGEASSSSY